MNKIRALEFFSGIGGFAEAARPYPIEVAASFDQDEKANQVYQFNFGRQTCSRNLDSIQASQIPPADLWWMSPPCAPYTVRGHRNDDEDRRAQSFLNLLQLITAKIPGVILIENVLGFVESRVHATLLSVLRANNYAFAEMDICSTELGTPMKRPRHFIIAVQRESAFTMSTVQLQQSEFDLFGSRLTIPSKPLSAFLAKDCRQFMVDDETVRRYGDSLNIIDENDEQAVAICFTSGYETCRKASGSLLRMQDGAVRRFSPLEIAGLLGFGESFRFPESIDESAAWRLLGNSVDTRCVRLLLDVLFKRPG